MAILAACDSSDYSKLYYCNEATHLPRVIALYSPSPGCGKTTVAEMLVRDYGYTRISYAAVLKDMTRVLLSGLGLSPEAIEEYMNTRKEEPLPHIHCSVRYLTRYLGTEYGREIVHDKLWLLCLQSTMQRLGLNTAEDCRLVIEDLRFPNEYEHLRSVRAYLMRIDGTFPGFIPLPKPRRQSLIQFFKGFYTKAPSKWFDHICSMVNPKGHASDGRLNNHEFHHTINNCSTKEALEQQLDDQLIDIQENLWAFYEQL